MKITIHNILDGPETAVEQKRGTIVSFGEKREKIDVAVNNEGVVHVSCDRRIMVHPIAANCFAVTSRE